jgi:hypothetical protein
LKLVLTYFTGGAKYSVPSEFALTYIITQLRFLFFSFVLSYYFSVPYTVITMALAVLLADFRFYIDFTTYVDSSINNIEQDEDY